MSGSLSYGARVAKFFRGGASPRRGDPDRRKQKGGRWDASRSLSLIHISEPTRPLYISYAVFCLKKKIPAIYNQWEICK